MIACRSVLKLLFTLKKVEPFMLSSVMFRSSSFLNFPSYYAPSIVTVTLHYHYSLFWLFCHLYSFHQSSCVSLFFFLVWPGFLHNPYSHYIILPLLLPLMLPYRCWSCHCCSCCAACAIVACLFFHCRFSSDYAFSPFPCIVVAIPSLFLYEFLPPSCSHHRFVVPFSILCYIYIYIIKCKKVCVKIMTFDNGFNYRQFL